MLYRVDIVSYPNDIRTLTNFSIKVTLEDALLQVESIYVDDIADDIVTFLDIRNVMISPMESNHD